LPYLSAGRPVKRKNPIFYLLFTIF